MSQPTPSNLSTSVQTSVSISASDASAAGYRRIAADLERLEASLPTTQLPREEREALRRHGAYAAEAVYAVADLALDPLCIERRVQLSRDEIDAQLARAAEAKRLARGLRRLARHVADDALVVLGKVATDTMLTLDMVDVLASRPGGEHLRARVDEARSLVRRERRPARARKALPVVPPKA